MTVDHLFHIGSMGKQFTSLALLMAQQRALLNITDLVQQHLPSFPFSNITIEHLLRHTSGLPADSLIYIKAKELNEQKQKQKKTTSFDLLQALITFPSLRKNVVNPNTLYAYNNAGYDLLSLIVEKVFNNNQSFHMILDDLIFKPCHMIHTFSLQGVQDKRRQEGLKNHSISFSYRAHNRVIYNQDEEYDAIVGSGSIYSTLKDMNAYRQALWVKKELLDEVHLSLFTKPTILNSLKTVKYGLGVKLPAKGRVAHQGQWLGFQSEYIYDQKNNWYIMYFVNRLYFPRHCSFPLAKEIHSLFFSFS